MKSQIVKQSKESRHRDRVIKKRLERKIPMLKASIKKFGIDPIAHQELMIPEPASYYTLEQAKWLSSQRYRARNEKDYRRKWIRGIEFWYGGLTGKLNSTQLKYEMKKFGMIYVRSKLKHYFVNFAFDFNRDIEAKPYTLVEIELAKSYLVNDNVDLFREMKPETKKSLGLKYSPAEQLKKDFELVLKKYKIDDFSSKKINSFKRAKNLLEVGPGLAFVCINQEHNKHYTLAEKLREIIPEIYTASELFNFRAKELLKEEEKKTIAKEKNLKYVPKTIQSFESFVAKFRKRLDDSCKRVLILQKQPYTLEQCKLLEFLKAVFVFQFLNLVELQWIIKDWRTQKKKKAPFDEFNKRELSPIEISDCINSFDKNQLFEEIGQPSVANISEPEERKRWLAWASKDFTWKNLTQEGLDGSVILESLLYAVNKVPEMKETIKEEKARKIKMLKLINSILVIAEHKKKYFRIASPKKDSKKIIKKSEKITKAITKKFEADQNIEINTNDNLEHMKRKATDFRFLNDLVFSLGTRVVWAFFKNLSKERQEQFLENTKPGELLKRKIQAEVKDYDMKLLRMLNQQYIEYLRATWKKETLSKTQIIKIIKDQIERNKSGQLIKNENQNSVPQNEDLITADHSTKNLIINKEDLKNKIPTVILENLFRYFAIEKRVFRWNSKLTIWKKSKIISKDVETNLMQPNNQEMKDEEKFNVNLNINEEGAYQDLPNLSFIKKLSYQNLISSLSVDISKRNKKRKSISMKKKFNKKSDYSSKNNENIIKKHSDQRLKDYPQDLKVKKSRHDNDKSKAERLNRRKKLEIDKNRIREELINRNRRNREITRRLNKLMKGSPPINYLNEKVIGKIVKKISLNESKRNIELNRLSKKRKLEEKSLKKIQNTNPIDSKSKKIKFFEVQHKLHEYEILDSEEEHFIKEQKEFYFKKVFADSELGMFKALYDKKIKKAEEERLDSLESVPISRLIQKREQKLNEANRKQILNYDFVVHWLNSRNIWDLLKFYDIDPESLEITHISTFLTVEDKIREIICKSELKFDKFITRIRLISADFILSPMLRRYIIKKLPQYEDKYYFTLDIENKLSKLIDLYKDLKLEVMTMYLFHESEKENRTDKCSVYFRTSIMNKPKRVVFDLLTQASKNKLFLQVAHINFGNFLSLSQREENDILGKFGFRISNEINKDILRIKNEKFVSVISRLKKILEFNLIVGKNINWEHINDEYFFNFFEVSNILNLENLITSIKDSFNETKNNYFIFKSYSNSSKNKQIDYLNIKIMKKNALPLTDKKELENTIVIGVEEKENAINRSPKIYIYGNLLEVLINQILYKEIDSKLSLQNSKPTKPIIIESTQNNIDFFSIEYFVFDFIKRVSITNSVDFNVRLGSIVSQINSEVKDLSFEKYISEFQDDFLLSFVNNRNGLSISEAKLEPKNEKTYKKANYFMKSAYQFFLIKNMAVIAAKSLKVALEKIENHLRPQILDQEQLDDLNEDLLVYDLQITSSINSKTPLEKIEEIIENNWYCNVGMHQMLKTILLKYQGYDTKDIIFNEINRFPSIINKNEIIKTKKRLKKEKDDEKSNNEGDSLTEVDYSQKNNEEFNANDTKYRSILKNPDSSTLSLFIDQYYICSDKMDYKKFEWIEAYSKYQLLANKYSFAIVFKGESKPEIPSKKQNLVNEKHSVLQTTPINVKSFVCENIEELLNQNELFENPILSYQSEYNLPIGSTTLDDPKRKEELTISFKKSEKTLFQNEYYMMTKPKIWIDSKFKKTKILQIVNIKTDISKIIKSPLVSFKFKLPKNYQGDFILVEGNPADKNYLLKIPAIYHNVPERIVFAANSFYKKEEELPSLVDYFNCLKNNGKPYDARIKSSDKSTKIKQLFKLEDGKMSFKIAGVFLDSKKNTIIDKNAMENYIAKHGTRFITRNPTEISKRKNDPSFKETYFESQLWNSNLSIEQLNEIVIVFSFKEIDFPLHLVKELQY